MLQNVSVTAFTVSELMRQNQQGVKLFPPLRLGLSSFKGMLRFARMIVFPCMILFIYIFLKFTCGIGKKLKHKNK